MKVVLGASAIAKLFFPEGGSELVERLLGKDIVVPSLARYEIGNLFWKRVSRGEIKEEEALRGWELFERLLKRWTVRDVPCLKVSLKCGITCYDASYVELTLREGAKLLTFDERLKKALRACKLDRVLL
ncbi:ribonuclease VapC3 [Ignicoccus pacificus DSM 13166]|uniref:Ribonuclease VapC3 n=1 Tax=Ignicoccus pacificus DSM 13166 TaxID=940294 RepID=A0A977K929_9CREN|nr:ribonuclease VapC3 [Ignicoccus pacificus DSM 13166]